MRVSDTDKVVFNGYSVKSTSFVYNSSGGTSTNDGWTNARSDDIAVQIAVATLNATSLTYRIEGRTENLNRAASLHTEEVTVAHSIDKIITISEKMKEIRIGAKIDHAATPNNFYCAVISSDQK